jgi:hypothetical protein
MLAKVCMFGNSYITLTTKACHTELAPALLPNAGRTHSHQLAM